jgi:hypothetical protein
MGGVGEVRALPRKKKPRRCNALMSELVVAGTPSDVTPHGEEVHCQAEDAGVLTPTQ